MKTRVTKLTGGVSLTVDGDSVKITKASEVERYAYDFINCARYFSNQAKASTDEDYWKRRSSVLSSIIMAYASIEATLHEFLHLRVLDEGTPISPEKREVFYWMLNENLTPLGQNTALKRFNLILRILEKEEMKEGMEPYQSANTLRLLRNKLIHPIPELVVTLDADNPELCMNNELTKKLKSILKLPDNATFPKSVLTPDCAEWASRAAERYLHEFESRAGIKIGFILKP